MSTDDQTTIDDLREELERKDQRIDELEQQMHEIASAVEQQDKTTPLKDRTGISRRELMGAALGGSVLGLGGAAASQEFSDSAEAAGSPAPDVGTPNDRVDVFGAEIDSNSVSTGDLRGDYRSQIRVITIDGITTIDPSATSTPVDDAAAAGTRPRVIEFPPESVQQSGPHYVQSRTEYRFPIESGVEFTDTGASAHGFVFDDTQVSTPTLTKVGFWNFRAVGPGDDTTTGYPLYFKSGNTNNISFGGYNHVINWHNNAIQVPSGVQPFRCFFGGVWHFQNVDAGDKDAVVNWAGGGPANVWNQLYFQTTDTSSGSDSEAFRNDTGGHTVRAMNVGGTTSRAVVGNDRTTVGLINYEPASQSSATDAIVVTGDVGGTTIQNLHIRSGNYDNIFRQVGSGNDWFTNYVQKGGLTPNNNVFLIDNDTVSGPSYFGGPSSEVTNNGGALSFPIVALGDLTLVQ